MMTHGRARKELPGYDALSASIQKEVNETLRGVKEPAEALSQIVGNIHERTHQHARRLRLRQILEYIDNHLHEDLERDAVASLCNITPGYFSTLFNETIGQPFVTYVNQRRIDKAKELLSSTELSIGEIAARTGFKSSAYFCSVFRKDMSMSPTSYRLDALSKYIHR
jgi:AraC-like DNA-binding protein